MAKWRDFAPLQKLPSTWTDAFEEMHTGDATLNFKLERSSSTAVRVVAGTGNDQVGLWIVSGSSVHPRWITATKSATHPGGAAGTYDILATANADSFGTSGGGEVDNTNHDFFLKIVPAGGSGSGSGSEAIWRKIGTLQWDGSAITTVSPLIGINQVGLVFYQGITLTPYAGQVILPSGGAIDPNWIAPLRIPLFGSKQTSRVVGAYGEVQGTAGATLTWRLWRKPWGGAESVPASWTNLQLTTAEQDFSSSLTPFSLTHRDRLRFEGTATSGSPIAYNPDVTLVLEHTVVP